uniref:Ig-like domain-containing protein n=1 Tax=Hippocampus comes TaxID=109280 RepID=A0A3Q2Z4W7_HIPCM
KQGTTCSRTYFCPPNEHSTQYDKTRVKVVLLSLAKPRIQPAPPLLKALVGQTVTLPCVVQGEPSPEVNWFHNGLPVGIKDTSPFRIQHVSMADKGTYQCVARNSAGQETLEIMLEILGEFLFLNTSLLQLK